MCGITGVLGISDKSLVRSMADRIKHRGPDGFGYFEDDAVAFGHRRLAIVDIEGGHQPMFTHDDRLVIVYNGEIYNHKEIRAELEALGHKFRTDHSDTEMVLEAYRAWGEFAFDKFEGMFALAIYDRQAKQVILARDRFGIKPFFWAWTPSGQFIFNSEMKGILGNPELEAVPNYDRIKERMALEFLRGQGTLLQGVHQLPPGTWIRLDPKKLKPGSELTWQPFVTQGIDSFTTVESAARAIRKRFVASVEEQLMSDVPLGVILSGGLDSAAVAAVHATLSEQPIDTFTIAESEEIEDFQKARQLADYLGTNHHESFFDVEDVIAGMPKFTFDNENINYTEFFFQPLFKEMRKQVTVGLCGQGSDELWGGYSRYKDPQALALTRLEKLRKCPPENIHELSMEILSTHQTGSSLAEYDQQGQLNNFQLRLVDRNSMGTSLEVRVPFLSRPLHRASRSIGWGWKIKDGVEKWVLRKAFEDLGMTSDLVWRPKVPAGRATAPKVIGQYEEFVAGKETRKPTLPGGLGCGMTDAVSRLQYRLWEETFIHRRGEFNPKLTVSDLL